MKSFEEFIFEHSVLTRNKQLNCRFKLNGGMYIHLNASIKSNKVKFWFTVASTKKRQIGLPVEVMTAAVNPKGQIIGDFDEVADRKRIPKYVQKLILKILEPFQKDDFEEVMHFSDNDRNWEKWIVCGDSWEEFQKKYKGLIKGAQFGI